MARSGGFAAAQSGPKENRWREGRGRRECATIEDESFGNKASRERKRESEREREGGERAERVERERERPDESFYPPHQPEKKTK